MFVANDGRMYSARRSVYRKEGDRIRTMALNALAFLPLSCLGDS